MNIPFDEDYNVTVPEPPQLDGEKVIERKNYPSAEDYETVPEDWKPRAGRELPALRCTFIKMDETRCKKFGIRGTGFNGTPALCEYHGGSLPSVKAKAEATLLAARMQLVANTGLALDTLLELTKPGTAEAIRLKASTEILDRAGIKGGFDVNVQVENTASPSEEILKKLQIMRDRDQSTPQDLGEQEPIIDAEVDNDDQDTV